MPSLMPRILLRIAKLALAVGGKSDIDRTLRRLAVNTPKKNAFVAAGDALVRCGRFDEADEVLSRGLAIYFRDAALLSAFAYSAHNRGHYDVAVRRWEALLEVSPRDPMSWCGLAANLRASRKIDRASHVISDALRLFPEDVSVLTEAARCATDQESFADALQLWDKALSRVPPHPDWLVGRASVLMRLKRFGDAATALKMARVAFPSHAAIALLEAHSSDEMMQRKIAADDIEIWKARQVNVYESSSKRAGDGLSPGAIFACFESLGDNCEFGLVQRYCGIEPLGLFRFSSSQGQNLAHAISTKFDEYGSDEDLLLILNEEDQEYIAKSKKYDDFIYHTEVFSHSANAPGLRVRELKKVAYLKKRILGDFALGEKIYVRKGGSFATMRGIFHEIRKIGPGVLLCVFEADDTHPPGHVEIVEDGLLRGYISRFAPYANAHRVDIECWLKICATCLDLAGQMRGSQTIFSIARNITLIGGDRWQLDCSHATVLIEEMRRCPGGRVPQRVSLGSSSEETIVLARKLIDVSVKPRSLVVFSAWVFIPKGFSGTVVDTFFVSSPRHFVWQADLSKREVWQRIWTSTRISRDASDIWVGLRANGRGEDAIFVGSWDLQEGCVPNELSLGTEGEALS